MRESGSGRGRQRGMGEDGRGKERMKGGKDGRGREGQGGQKREDGRGKWYERA